MPIEQDLLDRGVDARDWLRGLRPWDQFLIYCDALAKHPGTRLRAAQLTDDRHLAEIEKQVEAAKAAAKAAGEWRPPLEHFDPVVEAIHDLDDTLRLLSRTGVHFRPRPEMPQDRIRKRKRDYGLSMVQRILNGGSSGNP